MGFVARRLLAAAVTGVVSTTSALAQGGSPGSAMPFGAATTGAVPLMAAVSGSGLPGDDRQRGPIFVAPTGPLDWTGAAPLGTPMRRQSRGGNGPGMRCSPDGAHCISLDSYIGDVCRTIEETAQEVGLDPGFFSRLIWQESLFDAGAVSHAGAQGIAQFMPGTARERGLADPFNPAEALQASARLLVDLRAQFGNLGLAAAAYNAGPGRVNRFVSGRSRLPAETRHYVAVITGHAATAWRDGKPRPDYRLDGAVPFQQACWEKASGRGIDAFRAAPDKAAPAWGAVLAAHRVEGTAMSRYRRIATRLPQALRDRVPNVWPATLPGFPQAQMTVQLGSETEQGATDICAAAQEVGVACLVVRNAS